MSHFALEALDGADSRELTEFVLHVVRARSGFVSNLRDEFLDLEGVALGNSLQKISERTSTNESACKTYRINDRQGYDEREKARESERARFDSTAVPC